MIKNKIEILFCLVYVIEIDDIRVNCIMQSTLPVQIEKVIMFTDMYNICPNDYMFVYFVHLFITDHFSISMAAKDMYSVWFHWTPSLELSSAGVFQVWLSRSHDQRLHRTIFFKMAPLFSLWHARSQQKGNGFCVY